jgi:hypothetical protein
MALAAHSLRLLAHLVEFDGASLSWSMIGLEPDEWLVEAADALDECLEAARVDAAYPDQLRCLAIRIGIAGSWRPHVLIHRARSAIRTPDLKRWVGTRRLGFDFFFFFFFFFFFLVSPFF